MFLDALANFVPLGSNLPILGAPVASNIYDVFNVGPGIAPPNIIGNRSLFGTDLGIGQPRPQLQVNTNVAFAGPAGALLSIAFQGAPDTAVTYQPGAWTSIVNQDGLAIAQLAALSVVFRMDWPAALPANLNARYFRLLFTPVAASAFTAGSIGSAIVTMGRDDQANKFATKNFTV